MRDNIQENLKEKLQDVYGEMLKDYDIQYGDILPQTLMALEEAEQKLAVVVADWILVANPDLEQ